MSVKPNGGLFMAYQTMQDDIDEARDNTSNADLIATMFCLQTISFSNKPNMIVHNISVQHIYVFDETLQNGFLISLSNLT